ncbi:3-hydroxyacyl-CoA dehydrogenase family protein [Chloroflexota bacterium]
MGGRLKGRHAVITGGAGGLGVELCLVLLEIVRTVATSDETMEIGKEFGKSLGKTVIVARDTPGFVVNVLLIPFLLNAIRMYEAGLVTKEDIDIGVQLGLNYPAGAIDSL